MKAARRFEPSATAPGAAREFSRHLAHELKSYLANVRHSAELLAEGLLGPLPEKQQEVAQILRQNSLKLQWLTEYLLAYHAWSGTALRTPLDLRDLLERCVQRARVLAQPRRVRLAVSAPMAHVMLDAAAITLLLDNLLSHALKAAPEGGAVAVSARLEPDGTVVVEVNDDGPPAPAGLREGLIERFDDEPLGGRDGQPSPRGGLAVARASAAAHGGVIEFVDTARGGGVRARLPAHGGGAHAA